MTTKEKLRDAFKRTLAGYEDKRNLIPANLGMLINGERLVRVPGRPGFVYARLRGNYSELVEAYNDSTNHVFDLPVLVEQDRFNKSVYKVAGRDVGLYPIWPGGSGLAPHGDQHSFGNSTGSGSDVVWVFKRQFMPLLVHPHPDPAKVMWVQAEDDWFSWDNVLYHFTGTAMDTTPLRPLTAGKSVFHTFYLDDDNTLKISTGTQFNTTPWPDPDTLLGYIPLLNTSQGIVLSALLLHSFTTEVKWDNFYDLRSLFTGGRATVTGNSVILVDSDTGDRIEYPATAVGLSDANADATDGDAILLPEATITLTGTLQFKPNLRVVGNSELGSVLSGDIRAATGDVFQDVTFYRVSNTTLPIAALTVNTTGSVSLLNCFIRAVQTSGLGPAYAISFAGTGTVGIRDCYLRAEGGTINTILHFSTGIVPLFDIEAQYSTFANSGLLNAAPASNWQMYSTGLVYKSDLINLYANAWHTDYMPDNTASYFREGDRKSIFRRVPIPPDNVPTKAFTLDNVDQIVSVDTGVDGDFILRLPAIVENPRQIKIIFASGGGTIEVRVATGTSDTINGDSNLILDHLNDAADLVSDANTWRIS